MRDIEGGRYRESDREGEREGSRESEGVLVEREQGGVPYNDLTRKMGQGVGVL